MQYKLLIALGIILTLSYANTIRAEEREPQPTNEQLKASGTLPICYVNTVDSVEVDSKEEYVDAVLWIDPMGDPTVEPLGSEEDPVTLKIRGRGNSSWLLDKKPYKIKFDKKQKPFGFVKNKHFALLAHAYTASYIQEYAGFELARLIDMGYVPHSKQVEVVLNGTPLGLYGFYENIRVDDGRVEIDEQPEGNTDPETIPYGWLVEIDNYSDENQVGVKNCFGNPEDNPDARWIKFTSKSPENLSKEQGSWLTAELREITQMILNPDKTVATWVDKIDIESLAKYYIVQEITENLDAFIGSTYLYKGNGEKWTFGPVWDMSWSFVSQPRQNNLWETRGNLDLFVWIRDIVQFPEFRDTVHRIWNEFYQNKYNDIYSRVISFYNQTRDAYQYNANLWPQYNNVEFQNAYINTLSALEENARWFDAMINSEEYASVIESIDTNHKESNTAEWYTLQGKRLTTQPIAPGIYIRRSGSKTDKIVISGSSILP